MKKNLYESPKIELISLEVEGVLCASGGGSSAESFTSGNSLGSRLSSNSYLTDLIKSVSDSQPI